MFDIARFQIIGRVGKVRISDKVVRVSIAANASYKDNGQWVDRTNWNEVVIFDRNTRSFIEKHVTPGDYVRVEGTIRQGSCERNGERAYTTDLIAEEFHRQPVKKSQAANGEEALSGK